MTSNVPALRIWYADNFVVYYKAHAFHFNVQGPTFAQDHSLLEEVYDFMWDQHDVIGEQIRQEGKAVVPSLADILEISCITESTKTNVGSKQMFNELIEDIDTLMTRAQTVYNQAEGSDCGGVSTMAGDYLKALSKIQWKLKATNGDSIK